MAARHRASNASLAVCLLAIFACGVPTRTATGPSQAAAALPSGAEIRRDARTGTIRYLRASNLSEDVERDSEFRRLQSTNAFADVAVRFLAAHRLLFKLQRPADEVVVRSVTKDDLGLKHVRLQQVFADLPVWSGEILVHLDQANHVYLVQGHYAPTPSGVRTQPALSAEAALRIAGEATRGTDPSCQRCESDLVIAVVRDQAPRLAYRVVTKPSLTEGWAFLIDAETGAVLEKVSTVMSGGVVPKPRKRPRE